MIRSNYTLKLVYNITFSSQLVMNNPSGTVQSITQGITQTIVRLYQETDHYPVVQLWKSCDLIRLWNNADIDIYRKTSLRDNLFLVAVIDHKIVGSVMGGYDGHRGWANYLAVDPDYQKHGIGSKLMQNLEQRLIAKGCPKIQLLVRQDNSAVIGFYEQLGYQDADVICLGKRLIQD